MTKAKELARELKESYKTGDLHIIYVLKLIETVLSEPEPDLRGWIEVIPQHAKYGRMLININTGLRFIENGDATEMEYGGSCRTIEESYDSIKQKIKEAS